MISMMFAIAHFLFTTVVNPSTQCAGIGVIGGIIPFTPTCFLSQPYTIWFPIFFTIIVIVSSIIAIIYMLSPLLGRNDIKTWSKIKIYELLLTVFLAMVFLGASSLLYTVDPTSTLTSVGLLPQSCNPLVTNNVPSSYLIVDNMYSVALCDMYQYNQDVASYSTGIFYLAMIAGVAPQFDVNGVALTGGPPLLPSSGAGAGAGPGIGISLNFLVVPIQFVLQYIVPLMGAYFAVVILAQVQQILLASSMILFSVFMIIGFTARAFSVTKTFGGSMIAFALGIGFVYPLVTLISYGFLDVVLQNVATALGGLSIFSILIHSIFGTAGAQATGGIVSATAQILTSTCTNPAAANCNDALLAQTLTPFVVLGGFIASGLMLLPLLNLVIVDAFIVDMSRVIGERMDLMSLLTRIV